jgi:hypothetical protein
MNGCLFKTLLIITAFVAISAGYPHAKKFVTGKAESKISDLETKSTIFKKFIKYLPKPNLKEKLNNDDT